MSIPRPKDRYKSKLEKTFRADSALFFSPGRWSLNKKNKFSLPQAVPIAQNNNNKNVSVSRPSQSADQTACLAHGGSTSLHRVGLCCVEVERLERSQPFIGAENGPADCQTLVESGRLDQLVAEA